MAVFSTGEVAVEEGKANDNVISVCTYVQSLHLQIHDLSVTTLSPPIGWTMITATYALMDETSNKLPFTVKTKVCMTHVVCMTRQT